MIGYLRGKVKELTPDYVLLDVHGVGYEVVCTGAAFSRLSGIPAGGEGEVYTYMQAKEDGISLFGFADLQEKALFLKLTSVQGVGARLALSILSSLRPAEVSEAIALADAKRLSAVKGVGKKTAERIILELHGRISADELLAGAEVREPAASAEEDDAVSALMGMGFTKQESVRAVGNARKAGARSAEEIISAALRGM